MSTIDELLDAAKAATKSANDSELAKALGIRPAAVSNYRRGVSLPNAVVCATLAGLTGTPLARVLGIVGEARAISSDEKAVWRKLAATAMALCLAVGLALPRDAQAMQSSGYSAEHRLYIMRNQFWVKSEPFSAVAGIGSSFGLALASLPCR
ncbi:helix-turn-helix domain-containing protein [Stenotrophomonas sp. CFBP 13725]|nr:helix-turn-helix domain-containing protein [Stenotrophomonas sp. CFBP 13725]